MWPFSLPEKKCKDHVFKKFIAGVIIGGAIASIIGKRLLDKHENGEEDEEKD